MGRFDVTSGLPGETQRRINPEKKIEAPTAATTTAPQNNAPALPELATSRAVKEPITNSGRPTSHRQLTADRPGGVLNVRLMPHLSRAIAFDPSAPGRSRGLGYARHWMSASV